MFDLLFARWFSMKQCWKDCNKIMGGTRVREENQSHHIVKYSQNLLLVSCFESSFACCW